MRDVAPVVQPIFVATEIRAVLVRPNEDTDILKWINRSRLQKDGVEGNAEP